MPTTWPVNHLQKSLPTDHISYWIANCQTYSYDVQGQIHLGPYSTSLTNARLPILSADPFDASPHRSNSGHLEPDSRSSF